MGTLGGAVATERKRERGEQRQEGVEIDLFKDKRLLLAVCLKDEI